MSIFYLPNPTVAKTVQATLTDGLTVRQGELLCGDPATGMVVAAATADDTMVALGFAARDYVGDGVNLIEVELPSPKWLYTFFNDATSNIGLAFNGAYVKDQQTVQADGTGRPALGVVLSRTANTATILVGAPPAPAPPPPPPPEEDATAEPVVDGTATQAASGDDARSTARTSLASSPPARRRTGTR
jgi:hypothetical protein